MRTGGELLVACLEAQGVTTSFGVPGESYLAVLDGLHDSDIGFVICRQEGGVAYAASAWGKLTGEPGIAFVTRGPGATNAAVGLHTAMQDSSPMILFVGQASTEHLGREAFQEVDYRAFFGPLVKWATQIEHVDRVPEVMSRAFAVAQSGRPGPVVVALPEDVLSATSDAEPGRKIRVPVAAPTTADVDEVVSLLDGAERPLVLVGGGGWNDDGRRALQAMAEANSLPVAPVFRYHDLLDNNSPSFVGEAGVGMQPHMKQLIRDADVILAIGIRFGEMTTAAYTLFDIPDPAQTIIHVHPSDAEIGKLIQAATPIQASPNAFCAALADRQLHRSDARNSWRAAGRTAWESAVIAPTQPGDLDMAEIMQWLQQRLPEDVIITSGAGNFSIWNNKHFAYGPNMRLLAPQSGSMGYGLPAAIAAKVAEPNRMVVCFAGDGDIQMNIQELGTAMQAGAQPIVLVLNNGTYGTIRLHQERDFPTRVSGTEINNPDYVKIGAAYGFHAEKVERTAEFAAAFERAAASDSGALLELMVPPEMLSPTMSIERLRGQE
ncbi:MAG: thiamine pyrophosphate-binding protein [Acidimicrobiales bacterium]|nr:thiamine pyrophosphate-binding protein [Acidimicrobiales bacterium]RZV47673.1 MAG: thiamine pyrophosphate-binding protein [Acidimicrobiales bacterium]